MPCPPARVDSRNTNGVLSPPPPCAPSSPAPADGAAPPSDAPAAAAVLAEAAPGAGVGVRLCVAPRLAGPLVAFMNLFSGVEGGTEQGR